MRPSRAAGAKSVLSAGKERANQGGTAELARRPARTSSLRRRARFALTGVTTRTRWHEGCGRRVGEGRVCTRIWRICEKRRWTALAAADDADALEGWRVRYLSRKGGALSAAMDVIGKLAREERPAYGQAANEVKTSLETAFAERQEALKQEALQAELVGGTVDITLPGRPPSIGHLHITTQNLREYRAVFAEMGFEVYDGPDVETDEYNFGLLNMPPYHPARDMWDTFWVSQDGRSRPGAAQAGHADAHEPRPDPGDARALPAADPRDPARQVLPLRADHGALGAPVLPDRRAGGGQGHPHDRPDRDAASSSRRRCTARAQLRVRGSYFPFTEPSIEADMDCILCGGKGCGVCKYTGWLEIAGAGMVHPVVLQERRLRPRRLHRVRLRHGRRAAGDAAAIASTISGISTRTTCVSWSSSAKVSRGSGRRLQQGRPRRRHMELMR